MPTDPAGADEIRFAGQTVIVTGAGNGLGRAYALDCARLGARVVVNDLGISTEGRGSDRAAADYVVAEIRDAGGTAVANHDSVASADGCAAIAATALESFGTVHAVIHNAGFTRNAPFEEMDDDLLLPVLAVHLLGAFHLSRAVWPTLVANGYGRLVFTSSGSGVFGRTNGANYASAKAGIVGLANALALEGAPHGILVNTVMPVGATRLAGAPDAQDQRPEAAARRAESERTAPRSQPAWVSPLVVFLASAACGATHRNYSAVGGRYARIAIGVGRGWHAPDGPPPSADDVRAHLDVIDDVTGFDEPLTVFEEIERANAGRPPPS